MSEINRSTVRDARNRRTAPLRAARRSCRPARCQRGGGYVAYNRGNSSCQHGSPSTETTPTGGGHGQPRSFFEVAASARPGAGFLSGRSRAGNRSSCGATVSRSRVRFPGWSPSGPENGLGSAVLDTGGRLSAAEARRLACDARVTLMVPDSDSMPLDVGRQQRLATTALRDTLAQRDKGCAFPSCDRPPRYCHAHHIVS